MKDKIKWPAGNRLDLCIPLRKITVTEEGTQFGEYIPSQAAVVMVYFVGNYASYEYTPRIEDNKLFITDNGELKPGVYAIDVRIQEPERKLRSFRCGELEIVRETRQLALGDFVLDNNITLDADAFIFGEGPSAFEVAVRDGYTGTKAEWLESLRGREGRGIADIVALPTGAFRILLTDGSAYVTPILKGEQGVSIVDFTVSSITSQEVLCTITMSDGTTHQLNLPRGEKGEQGDAGEDGRGIQSVVMNNDYTITFSYTDGTSYTTPQALRGEQGAAGQDGQDGQDGRGISSMALDDDNHLTVSYSDGTTYTTPQSLQGERGVGITDFEQVGENATMCFFNVYYSNGNISQIGLPKGEQGDRGEQGPQGPKGDTVVLGEVGEYKLYNIGGTATDGAMTQDATTKAIAANTGYYECGTAAGTAAKVAVGDNEAMYTLQKGGSIKVKMTNANAAASGVTLKIGSAAATPLYYNGDAVSASNTWEAGEVISVYYDGTEYQATNAQGGSNKETDAYLYGDLRTLAVGQTYEENEAVKTTDKQFLRITKKIKTINLVDEVADGDLKAITSGANLGTYKALKEVKNYNGTETEGLYSIGKPSIVTITVDASSLSIAEDTDITVTIGNDSKTITVPAAASETKDADVAALIKTAFTSVPGWNLTDNEDGTLTLKCTTAGNNTISISSDTGETGLVISSNAVNGNSVLNQYNNGVWETVNINTWVADTTMWDSLDGNELSIYTEQNTVTKDIDVKLYGKYDYYTDGTYLTKGTTADASTNWITFPIVKGHTYRIWLKSNKPYYSNSAGTRLYMSNVNILGTPTVAEMLAGCYRDLAVPASSTATSSGVHLNAGKCVAGVEIYVKVIDLTDATTQAEHEITKPSVLLPKDVVNNLVDGGTEKVLSAEMGKEIGKAISTMKDLELQPLVRKTWGNNFALTDSTTRVCTADAIFVPYFGMTVRYKLPTGYWIYAAFSTFKNPGTLDENTGWLEGSGTFTIPSDRAQYRIQFAKGSSRNQTLTIEEIQGLLDSESITFQYESDNSLREIIRRNEHNRYIYSTIIDYGSKKNGLHQLPTFVHGSDVHGDRIRMRNMMKFADHIKAHAALITGDFVAVYPTTGYGFINVISDEFNTPMLICDGNHDAQSPLNNDTNRYNAMFKHLAEKHGYMLDDETLSTKCYYYYDMTAIKIRVISVDLYEGGSSFSSTQQTWLKETMASTPNGYGIIIIDHVQVTSGLTPIQNAEDWYIKPTNAEKTALRDIVSAFIGRTGDFSEATTTAEFIMFCNGHNHWDGIGYVMGTNYKQLNCNVDTMNGMYAASTLDSQTSRFPRILGDQSEDLFNVYAIDRANKQVRIARVGANMTGDFTKIEHVVVKYAD